MRVCAASDEAVIINHLANFLGRATPVTGELHTFVTNPGNGFNHAGKISFALGAQRIKLEADRNFLAAAGFFRGATGQAKRRAGDPGGGELKKFAAWD